jgi:hypothetical protein
VWVKWTAVGGCEEVDDILKYNRRSERLEEPILERLTTRCFVNLFI